MGRRSWKYILIILTWVSFGDAFGQVELRQMVPADSITTGDSVSTGERPDGDYWNYFIVTNDTVTKPGQSRQKYNYLPEWIGIDTFFTKTDSVCLVLNFPRTDTVCTKIDTLNVIYGDPSDTSYYFQLQINGGLIDSMTHMELWQINQGANITLNYDGTALTVSADSCLQRLEQLTDSTFRITDCDGNPLDTMLLPGGGGGGTDDQEITQFEISNDTIYLTLEDGGGQKFLVVQHPDTCFHSAEAVTDSSFQILDCNGVPLDTVTLRFPGGTDTHFANTNLSATGNRTHNWKSNSFFLDSAGFYAIRQYNPLYGHTSVFTLDAFGTFQLQTNSDFASKFYASGVGRMEFETDNSAIWFNSGTSLYFGSGNRTYQMDKTPIVDTSYNYVLAVRDTNVLSFIRLRDISDLGGGSSAPDSLEYRGDSIAIIGSNALNIYDLIDTSSFGDTDTRIDSLRQINDGLLDSVWLYTNDLSDSLLMVFNDSVGMDPDWYLIDDTVPPGTIDESIWTNGRVRIGQDSLENAFTLMVNGGIAPFEMVSSAPTNIMRQRHRTEGTAWDHSYQAGVYSIISQNLNTAESGYYISMPEGYVGDATRPLVRIDSSDIGFWKYPSSRNDVTSVDSISALYYPAYDGEIRIAPIDSVLKRLDRDSTTHRDFDFLLLAEGDTLGTNLDSLIPDDSLDLYNLIWHGGQVRLHNTEWDQRYDTLAFGPTDSTTALQIMGERDAIDIYHNFYPYIWMRNAKADAHWRLHNNDNTVDSFPAYMELGFTSWYDSTGTAYLRDTSSRWPLRISSQSNHRAFVLERDSLILGDYKSSDVDTSLTVADLAGSAFYMPSATGKVQLVSPDTVNAFLNVVSSNPDIAFWGFKQDSFGINFLGDIDSIFADFSHLNNSNIYIGSDTLYLGDTFALLPQGADSLGTAFTNNHIIRADGTRGGQADGELLFDGSSNSFRIDNGAEGTSYFELIDNISQVASINKVVASSYGLMDISVIPSDGSGSAGIRFNRNTNSTGNSYIEVLYGDNTATQGARISGNANDSWIARYGDLAVGHNSPNAQLHVDGTVRLDNLAAGSLTHLLGTDADNDVGEIAIGSLPYDNYSAWNLQAGGGTLTAISSGEDVNFNAGSGLTVSRGANTITYTSLWQRTNASRVELDNADTLYFGNSHRLELDGGIIDYNGTRGSSGQVLRTTGSDVYWGDLPDASSSNELQDLSYTASTRTMAISDGTNATIPLFTSSNPGLVSGSGGGTTNFLRADGTWAAPSGGGGGIYGGSDNVTGSTVASITSGSSFAFNYNTGNQELTISSSGTFLRSNQGTSSNAVELDLSGVTIEALGTDDDVSIVADRDVIITSGSGSSDQVIINAEGGLVATFDGTDTRINSNIQIGDNVDDQLEIISSAGSHVQIQHEDIASDAAYIRFFDNGNIGIIGNGSFVSIDAGSSSSSEVIIDGNIQLGTLGSNGSRVITISNGTVPTTSPSNAVQIYSQDVSSSAELRTRDEAGNITTLSPHNFSKIPEGPSEEMAWSYYSERDGKYINVDMLKLARLVEELTGEKLVYTNSK